MLAVVVVETLMVPADLETMVAAMVGMEMACQAQATQTVYLPLETLVAGAVERLPVMLEITSSRVVMAVLA